MFLKYCGLNATIVGGIAGLLPRPQFSHGRGHRFNPCRAHQYHQQFQSVTSRLFCSNRRQSAYKSRTQHAEPWRIRGLCSLRVPTISFAKNNVPPAMRFKSRVRCLRFVAPSQLALKLSHEGDSSWLVTTLGRARGVTPSSFRKADVVRKSASAPPRTNGSFGALSVNGRSNGSRSGKSQLLISTRSAGRARDDRR